MSTSIQTIIENGNLLNQKIVEKCRKAEEIIKAIALAYKQPVDENCPFVVSFIGRFKTGKSSLINALIGADILPTKATTATSVVTRIFYGKSPKCWIRSEGQNKEISIEEGNSVILNYKISNANKPVEVIFELPIPWIKGNIELRDTPGMDDSSQDGKLETITLNALKDTDLCICVYDASTMISEKERIRTQKIHKMMSGNVVFVVNCLNRLNSIEGLNQVEKIAKNFFGTMPSSTPNMGKYYMVCSAPKMIELDGFDKWLQTFVKETNLTMLNKTRNSTGIGQVLAYKNDFIIEAQRYAEQIEQQIAMLTENHDEILKQKQQANTAAVENEVVLFDNKVANLSSNFAYVSSELQEKMQAYKDTVTDYASKTKSETQDYFINRYNSIIENYNKYFSKNDVQFIRKAFQSVTFPSIHIKTIEATTGSKTGWTAVGIGIGWLVGGPIGGAIAGAIGHSIGNSDTVVDDSIDNTMIFVNTAIVPLMRKAINEKISKVRKNIKNKTNKGYSSGFETIISETQKIHTSLKKYLA